MHRGSLIKSERKQGPAVWQFRCSEKDGDGRRVYRKRVIGTVDQYCNEVDARRSVVGILAMSHPVGLLVKPGTMTIAELSEHFQHRELTHDDNWRSYSTRRNYLFYLKRWVIPRWGNSELGQVRTIDVEFWLRSLPLARSSCARIRNLMSVLFNHTCRYELFDRNPINSFVRVPRGDPLQMCLSRPKSSCSSTISHCENGLWFVWLPQPVCARVRCLPSSGVT